LDVLRLQVRKIGQDLGGTDTLGEHLEDICDPDAHAPDTGATATLPRVGGDSGFELLLVQD
jgi:hypothetical protein